jgi:beta-lactamase regulating signal transducer with metallopeptidase domain
VPSTRTDVLDAGLAALWSAGLAALVLRLIVGLAGAVRLTREATALGGPAWQAILHRFLSLVALGRPIRLKSHPRILVPLTWGWRKPVVLMPADTEGWTEEERSSALLHELSHIKRADFVVTLLVRLSMAVYWFNPLCWIVYRELRKEQEIACDELVLRAGIRPSTYAASLLALRRSAGFRWNPSAALLGMLGKGSFNERLAAILGQKLTIKEVKMKTRITLAAAVVLAVAMIGAARPAAGIGQTSAAATVVESALPAPAPVEVVLPEAGQEKAAVKEKEKAKTEKKVTVEVKEGVETPIVITITDGHAVKTLTLDKPLTITTKEKGDVLVMTSEGKEIEVLEGAPLKLEIVGGDIQVVEGGKALKVGEHGALTIVKEGEPAIAWTVKEPGKEGAVWVTKEFSGKTYAFSPAAATDMLEKVQALQEQVQAIKAKKMDLSALEESLKKLEAELKANEEKLEELHVTIEKRPGEHTVVKRMRGDAPEGKSGIWVSETGKTVKIAAAAEGTVNIILTGNKGDEGKKAFELALSTLKKELPEGYKVVGQGFDPEAGTMTFGIAVPEGKKTDEAAIRKVVDRLKEVIKTDK